jgi:HK97 family phage prohead protease
MKQIEYKGAQTEIKDVDESGVVVFYASVFGNKDYGNDVIEKGAYRKTIKENFKNIRHFKHHDSSLMPGVVQELSEDDNGLLVKSKLILSTQLGKETHEEYKAMMEAKKSMDHSIGYNATKFKEEIDPETEDYTRFIKEVKLYEVSTLTAWGMNPLALTVDVKKYGSLDMDELLKEERYFRALLNCKFTDMELANIEKLFNHVKTLIDERSRETTPPVIKPSIEVDKIINNFKINI